MADNKMNIMENDSQGNSPKNKKKKAILILAFIILGIIVLLVWIKNYAGIIKLDGAIAVYENTSFDKVEEPLTDILESALSKQDITIEKMYYRKGKIYVFVDNKFEELSDISKIGIFTSIINRSTGCESTPMSGTFDVLNSRITKWQAYSFGLQINAENEYEFYSGGLYKNNEKIYETKEKNTTYKSSGISSKSKRTCPNCNGTGMTKTYSTNDPLEEATYIECPMCRGTGKVTG